MGTIPQLSIIKGSNRSLHPKSLDKIFASVAEGEDRHKTAIIFEESSTIHRLTFQHLHRLSNRLSRALLAILSQGTANKDGDYLVAVRLPPNQRLLPVLLAVWKAGAAYLPLDRAFPEQRTQHILGEARPTVLVHEGDFKNYPGTYAISIEELWKESMNYSDENLEPENRVKHLRDDLALVLYTSGSTGVPKGVRIPHRIILNRLYWQFREFPYGPTEQACVFKTALTFVDSVAEIWGPLLSGRSLVVVPKSVTQDPERLVHVLEKYEIERLVLVPSLLRSILMFVQLQKKNRRLPNLQLWVCSGETLTVQLTKDFFSYFQSQVNRLCNFYGSTEIMGDVTYHVISSYEELMYSDKVPIGLPVDNTAIYLLNEQMQPVAVGEVGELYVSGLNLAAGYVNGRDPDRFIANTLSVDPSHGRLYRTGDFAYLSSKHPHVLQYSGRRDAQVKVRGHRVDLAEVERAVLAVPGVTRATVLCWRPGQEEQQLVAFVQGDLLMEKVSLEASLRERLTEYAMPLVEIVDDWKELVNGKVDRMGLLEQWEKEMGNGELYQKMDYSGLSSDQMEAGRALFETIASTLHKAVRGVISLDANFYEIGGNSINSISTISQLNEKGYRISVTDFVSSKTLGEILKKMTSDMLPENNNSKYTFKYLENEDKNIVTEIITASFYTKADLEQWLLPDISEPDYVEIIDKLWDATLAQNLSFLVKDEQGNPVAVALNFDARDEPELELSSKMSLVFEFLEYIEGPIRESIQPKEKGHLLHVCMMGTHASLSNADNVEVMKYMEDEVLSLTAKRGFKGVLTTNTNPLTQQLGTDIFGYKTMLDYQVNQYVASDNTRPFGKAPDSQRAIVQWKPVN